MPNNTTKKISKPSLNVGFVGASNCGKSLIINRLLRDEYGTISGGGSVDFSFMKLPDGTEFSMICRHPFSIGGWGYRSEIYIKHSDVIVLVFSFADEGSFDELKDDWYPSVLRFVANENVSIYLVGTACDVEHKNTELNDGKIEEFMNFTQTPKQTIQVSNKTDTNPHDQTTQTYYTIPILKYYKVSAKEDINIKKFYHECLVPDMENKLISLNGVGRNGRIEQHTDVDFEDNKDIVKNNDTNSICEIM